MPQTLRVPHRLVLVALLAALGPPSECADLHLQFKSWSVTCSGDRYCTASTRLRSSAPQLPYAFRLRVSRYGSGEREIAFLPAREPPAASAELSVQVDTRRAVTLARDSGYRAVGGGNTYVVVDADSTAALIEAMRGGKRVQFGYQSAQGTQVTASFPLDGFAPALAVVDPRPARHLQPAAAPTPESVAAPAAPAPEPASEPVAVPAAGPVLAPEAPAVVPAVKVIDPPAASAEPKRTAAASAKPSGPPPGRRRVKAVRQFACLGNEPPWNLIIDNDKARFELLLGGAPETVALAGKLKVTGEGRTPDVDWRGKSADGRPYRALIQQQACTDTMSDAEGQTAFDYRVQLTVPGGRMLRGCCSAGLEPPRAAPAAPAAQPEPASAQAPVATLGAKSPMDWSRMLMELMPAIGVCLESTPGSAPYVTKAWSLSQDIVVVRTRNATVGWFECVANHDGRSVQRFRPVESAEPPVPGEATVLFTPAAHAPPSGNCFTHERVVDTTGNHIGWLSTNACTPRSSAQLAR